MATKAKKLQTHSQLRELQRLAGAVIMRPLARDWRMQRRWIDDRDMRVVTGEFIKPNDRLTSFERIEIYNRQYWFRLIDSFYEDFPGLLATLGRLKFNRLARAYIVKHPSRSFTLRNLGRHLAKFIESNPKFVEPRFDLSVDLARFEWAQVEAFDGLTLPPISVDDLLGKDPAKLRLGLQPYMSVMELRYPLDDFVIKLKKSSHRGETSNAVEEMPGKKSRPRRTPIPRRKTVHVAVHRQENALYYKRLDSRAYRLLTAIRDGQTLAAALEAAFPVNPDPELIREWFSTWTELGWFCKRRSH